MIDNSPMARCDDPCTHTCKLDSPSEDNITTHTSSISTVSQLDTEELLHTHRLDDNVDNDQPEARNNDSIVFIGDITCRLDNSLKRLDKGLKNFKMLDSVLDEFCTIEGRYIEQLRSLRNRMNLSNTPESTGTLAALSSLKSYITRVAENHTDFLDALSNDCILPDEHFDKFTDLQNNVCTIRKDISDCEGKRTLCINEVENAFLQVKKTLSACTDPTYQVPSAKIQLHRSLISLFTNFFDLNSKACTIDLEFNSSRETFNETISSIILSIQDLDRRRLIDMRDILCKFMIYETAKVRNLQYDLSSLIATLNEFDPSKDLEEFYASNNINFEEENASIGIINSARDYVKNFKFTVPEFFHYNSQYPRTLKPPPNRVIDKIKKKLDRFVTAIWNHRPENISIKEFSGEMHSSLVREIFCNLIANRSIQSSELPFMECLKILGRMILVILAISEHQIDSWCGYIILGFSDVIYSTVKRPDGSTERVYLRSVIYSHSYWNRISFWEECLTVIISSDLKENFETLNGLHFSRTHKLKPMTKESLSFGSWMVNYGVMPNAARELIMRVCNKFKLSESYASSLVNW